MQTRSTKNMTSDAHVAHDNHSVMAERAVLGGLLRTGNTLEVLAVLLTEDDFYLHANRLIFRQILACRNLARPILIAVAEALELTGELAKIGGIGYLNSLLDGLPSDTDIQHCAVILRERLVSRSAPQCIDEDLRVWAKLLRKQSRERVRNNLLKLNCAEIASRLMNVTGDAIEPMIDAAIVDLLKLKEARTENDGRGRR